MSLPACDSIRGDLAPHVRGGLPAARRAEIERHLLSCSHCADDSAFATEIEQAMARSSGDRMSDHLGDDFARRVMATIERDAMPHGRERLHQFVKLRPVRMLRPLRHPSMAVLASAAAVLVLVTLSFRSPSAPVVPSGDRMASGFGARLKVALELCDAKPSAVAGDDAWAAGLGRFPAFAPDEGAGADPGQDAFYLAGPYASLFSGGAALPRYESIGS